MATMTVCVPDPMTDWIEAQFQPRDCASTRDLSVTTFAAIANKRPASTRCAS